MSKKIITVFGATGNQGGSIVNIFLNDPKLKNEWTVRGVTRDATTDRAKALAAKGAKVVSVSLPRISPNETTALRVPLLIPRVVGQS